MRVANPKRRGASYLQRCIRLAVGGLGASAIVLLIAATAIAAAGRVLAVSVDARLETRSVIGLARPAGTLAWFTQPDRGMVPQVVAAQPEPTLPADGLLPDDIVTGSLGRVVSLFDVTDAALAGRFQSLHRRGDAHSLPVPRARPRLAALSPGDIKLKPDGEEVPSSRTAIYDIAAQTVYMPNGQRLEAHSGYGQFMDDPKYVRLRMRGVTPPNTYKLTMREALFHGVEAIRMTPENKDAMFGRNGILAHSYMLGPNGQSNGCVSIKDYAKFLAAFKRGEVDRMVVVFRLPKPPAVYARGDKGGRAL